MGYPDRVNTYLGSDGYRHNIRDNLLVTFGCRAGSMEAAGYITLPEGSRGEDDLAIYAEDTIRSYMSIPEDTDANFDEYIEGALLARYGKEF